MTRIFLNSDLLKSDLITISGDQARHLSLVLRVKPGEEITLFDGSGFKYVCKVLRCHKKEVTATCISKSPYSIESPLSTILAQGIPKGDKMDMVIQKSTELGVNTIFPLFTERSQIHNTHKLERWKRIALSASEQSGRERVPDIKEPMDYHEFISGQLIHRSINDSKACLKLILYESKKERTLKRILEERKDCKQAILLIGPEGGFSREEVKSASENNFEEISLGPRILRTETAPLSILSIIQFALGDMG